MLRALCIATLVLFTACDESEPLSAVEIGPPNDGGHADLGTDVPDDLDVTDTDVGPDVADAPDVPPDPPLIPRVDIRISTANINALHRDVHADVEVDVDIEFGGELYTGGELEIHGGFARTVPKLSYRIRFDSDRLAETTLFSDEPEVHQRIVLQASWIDPTYMRNCLTLDLVRELGGLAPRCEYVELFFNGEYHGLYVAIERVDEHFLRRNGLAEGGLVLKASSNRADWSNVANPMAGLEVKVNLDAPTGGISELIRRVQQTPADYDSFVADVEPWLDLDDFMSWQTAHTIADNRDTFTKNYYLHYDWENADSPFRIITWDADATWGLNWDGATVDPTVREGLWGNDRFSPRLFGIAEYEEPYTERYASLVVEEELAEWVRSNADERAERIEDAAERDLFAWERALEFDDERDYLDVSIDARFDILRAVLD